MTALYDSFYAGLRVLAESRKRSFLEKVTYFDIFDRICNFFFFQHADSAKAVDHNRQN
jgi:hypothetical protein